MKDIACTLLLSLSFLTSPAQPSRHMLPSVLLGGVTEVACSMQDTEGFWWYGGKGLGLCRFDGYETESFLSNRRNPDMLRSNDVLCMTEQTENAEIWFGTKEGAYILDKHDYIVHPVSIQNGQEGNELADKRINCMVTAGDGSVWMAFRNQLLHFSPKAELTERFETTWMGKTRSVVCMCLDTDGTLWAGLWNGGIVRLTAPDGKRHMEDVPWTRDDYPAEIYWEPTHKELAVKTSEGSALLYNPRTGLWQTDKRKEHITAEEQKQRFDSVMLHQAPRHDNAVLSWAARDDSSAYVGTYHSLYIYDGQHVKLLQGELDKVRSMAYSERTQTLYLLSKALGVCQWKDERLTVLLDSTFFQHVKLQGDSALLLSNGIGNTDMLHLPTMRLRADTTTTDIHPTLTAYAINGERHPLGYGQKVLRLPKGADILEIYLSSLDYEHSSQVQFAYRIGTDTEWTYLPEGENTATFAHIRGAGIALQVRVTDAYGRWSAPETVLTIESPMTWYERTWVWVLLFTLSICGGLLLARTFRKEITQQKEIQPENDTSDSSNTLSAHDREFLDKAAAAVSSRMTDSDYSVDALAADLCMSRANLHRKMRAVTGQTPTDFIRNQRLERACELLRTTSHSVNEIADLVGFSYASYFTKCFKEKYGVLPKDF